MPAQSLRPGRHSPGRISVGPGRDSVYPEPPAQIPACGATASVNARKATVQAHSPKSEKNAIMLDEPAARTENAFHAVDRPISAKNKMIRAED